MKSDDSPLTKADTAANQIICHALQLISPYIPIISEENKVQPYSVRKVGSGRDPQGRQGGGGQGLAG